MATQIKIALAMIVKGSKDESDVLYRCLQNVLPHVDKAFITITHTKGKKRDKHVESVCNVFNDEEEQVVMSDFEWVDDFSAARNFNFSQVPKEYSHILWCDADDVFRGLERLRSILIKDASKERPSDGFGMWYLYHFDDYKQADVVHKKTMVVRNPNVDNWVEWRGRLHEDLISLILSPDITMIDKFFNGGIDRMHMLNSEMNSEKTERNIRISKRALHDAPEEPRNYFNYAQSLHHGARWKDSMTVYKKFLKVSGSEEEKFLARLRISESMDRLNDHEGAVLNGQIALGMRPEYPDAYFHLGQLFRKYHRIDDAEKFFLMGLKMRPKYESIIVFNPRDYDYNPMRMLIGIYEDKGRPDLGIPFMDACLKIYPQNQRLRDEYESLKKETARLTDVVAKLQELKDYPDDELKIALDALPVDLRSHPGISQLYNQRFVKTHSNGHEVSIYCYPTAFDFNPELFEKVGFGGSEEAVINLSKGLAELGWDVTVYNRCGPVPKKYGKVWFKPFWMWNYRDTVDALIIWRSPKPLDFELGAKRVYLDLHDVVPPEEFTESRLKKLTKIFVKTKAHRSLFPKVPDSYFAIIPNGQDNTLFSGKVKKDPYLIINTSSPDRSMDVLPELFREIKRKVPQAKLKWAYGWKNYDDLFKSDPLRQKWKKEVEKQITEAGIECLGKIPQKDVAHLYEEASVLAYPSEFFEIDCISVKKAQAAGCIPATTDFAAFDESVKFGVKIPSKKTTKNWSRPYQMGYGITDPDQKKKWVDSVVELLKDTSSGPGSMRALGMEFGRQFDWDKIALRWDTELKGR